MKFKHRVWIEIEYPRGGNEEGEQRAFLMTNLLRKLGAEVEVVWWNNRKKCYCLTIDSAGSFLELSDNGHWFNLEVLGKLPNSA